MPRRHTDILVNAVLHGSDGYLIAIAGGIIVAVAGLQS